MARDHVVYVRVSDCEYADISKRASALGLTRSAYLRFIATAPIELAADGEPAATGDIIILRESTMRHLLVELSRQGSNLNQIAHAVNAMNAKGWVHPGEAGRLIRWAAQALEANAGQLASIGSRIDRISERAFAGVR